MSKCECEQCAAPDHPEDCECGACEGLLLASVWNDLPDYRPVSRLCWARHGVDIDNGALATDTPLRLGGLRVPILADWTVSHILTIASRMVELEAKLLEHDANCFCAACLTKQKDAA